MLLSPFSTGRPRIMIWYQIAGILSCHLWVGVGFAREDSYQIGDGYCPLGGECVMFCYYPNTTSWAVSGCWQKVNGSLTNLLFCVEQRVSTESATQIVDKGGLQPHRRWPEMKRNDDFTLNLTIHFRNVKLDDGGTYYCNFTNSSSVPMNLTVYRLPESGGSAEPQFDTRSFFVAIVVIVSLLGFGVGLRWLLGRRNVDRPDIRGFRLVRPFRSQ